MHFGMDTRRMASNAKQCFRRYSQITGFPVENQSGNKLISNQQAKRVVSNGPF